MFDLSSITNVIVWSGWIGGIAVGLYGIFQFTLSGKLLGVSTGYGNLCSFAVKTPYFHTGTYKNANNWRLYFLIGLPIGGLIAALTSPGDIQLSFSLGEMYNSVISSNITIRGLILTAGGLLMGIGARMAGGCTSGHAISGISLLNPPSIIAAAGFFTGGIIIVQLLFNVL